MDKNEALSRLRKVCPPEFYGSLEFMSLEDLIHQIYDNGLMIVDRIIHVEGENK